MQEKVSVMCFWCGFYYPQEHMKDTYNLGYCLLQSVRERGVCMREDELAAVLRARLPEYEDSIHQSILQDLYLNGDICRGSKLENDSP